MGGLAGAGGKRAGWASQSVAGAEVCGEGGGPKGSGRFAAAANGGRQAQVAEAMRDRGAGSLKAQLSTGWVSINTGGTMMARHRRSRRLPAPADAAAAAPANEQLFQQERRAPDILRLCQKEFLC